MNKGSGKNSKPNSPQGLKGGKDSKIINIPLSRVSNEVLQLQQNKIERSLKCS